MKDTEDSIRIRSKVKEDEDSRSNAAVIEEKMMEICQHWKGKKKTMMRMTTTVSLLKRDIERLASKSHKMMSPI